MSTQYGEEKIILDFFPVHTRNRFVVDVGAADGTTYSNSCFLIREYGWSGILIEPDPINVTQIYKRHLYETSIRIIQAAAGVVEAQQLLWPAELGSTLVPSWKARIERDFPECKFGDPIPVRVAPLKTLLHEANCPDTIDFLTIDAEGMDVDVLLGMDFSRYNVRLICVESGDDGTADDPLNHTLKDLGFKYHARTRGNTFWRKPE